MEVKDPGIRLGNRSRTHPATRTHKSNSHTWKTNKGVGIFCRNGVGKIEWGDSRFRSTDPRLRRNDGRSPTSQARCPPRRSHTQRKEKHIFCRPPSYLRTKQRIPSSRSGIPRMARWREKRHSVIRGERRDHKHTHTHPCIPGNYTSWSALRARAGSRL